MVMSSQRMTFPEVLSASRSVMIVTMFPDIGGFVLQQVDDKKQGERDQQHDRSNGCRSGVVILFEFRNDQQGSDLGFERDVC